jgi:hypothetical protein
MTKNEFGVFEITLPDNADGSPAIPHGSRVKVRGGTEVLWSGGLGVWGSGGLGVWGSGGLGAIA